ncbi:M48 family metallopeptidase [Citreicella sp. C3M06]|uniref:M48 family metallopeptidase n=1 Tax=Citreicella sp. C3M06 TaxID=2841564 RepID=UPI001C095463|nr:M48 family metallopeptidase [Citreicella sp. C3M06]MBU2963736.1 M48 family metallopeptidase [Citreicella sp. C3M06]
MRRFLPLLFLALAACGAVPIATTPTGSAPSTLAEQRAERATRQFIDVATTVEPVVEDECRRSTRGLNCDFLIVVDDRPAAEANAFQTLDDYGRPILAFNLAMIASVQNPDELAFVMSHESAHHILGHLARVEEDAAVGAIIFSGLAAMSGADDAAVRTAEEFGASVGARTFSKEYELQADQLGTILAIKAGYDPLKGAAFFTRIPDPGDRFLGSHPPNAARIEIVRRTAETYRATN